MKPRMLMLVAIVLTSITQARADADAGKEKAGICGPCHGVNGVSNRPRIPSLAAQPDQYIRRQLLFFRSGRRPNPTMGPLAARLSDDDVGDLAAYFSNLPYSTKTASDTLDTELAAKGEAIVSDQRCARCHSDTFRGKRSAAAIANQREDYLIKALTDYRSASRLGTGAAAMTEVAADLNDDEIDAVSHYLATLGQPQR